MKPNGLVRIAGFRVDVPASGKVLAVIAPRYFIKPQRIRLFDRGYTLGSVIYVGGSDSMVSHSLVKATETVWQIEPKELVEIAGPRTALEFSISGAPGKVHGAIVGDEYVYG